MQMKSSSRAFALHRLSKNVSHLPPGRLFPVQSHQWLTGKILLSRSRAMSAMAGSPASPILARWGGMALDLGDE